MCTVCICIIFPTRCTHKSDRAKGKRRFHRFRIYFAFSMPKQWTIDVRALSLTTIQFSRAWSCSPSTSQQSIERAHYSAEFESSEFNQKLKQNKTKRTKNNNLHKYIFEVSFVINYRAVYQAKKKYLANFDKIVAVWVRCSNAYRKRTPPKKKINQNAVFMLKEEEKKFMCASQNTFDFWELCFHSLKLRHDI